MSAPDIQAFMRALTGQESGGNADATSPLGAHGLFQIMPANWPSWAQEAGLPADAPQTPENQTLVAQHKLQQYYDTFGNWDDVAAAWYSGQGMNPKTLDNPQPYGPTIREYVNQVHNRLGGTSAPLGAGPGGVGPAGTGGVDVTDPTTGSTPGALVDPVLLDKILKAFEAQQPDLNKPATYNSTTIDPGKYQSALQTWGYTYTSILGNIQQLTLASKNLYQLPNGQTISGVALDPATKAALDASNAAAAADLKNKYLSSNWGNQFDYQKEQFNEGNQAAQTRLAAQGEARQRATAVTDAMQAARGWAAPEGKTSFSLNDLGGSGSILGRMIGQDPSQPFLNYTGQAHIDPASLLSQYDQITNPALGSGVSQGPPSLIDPTGAAARSMAPPAGPAAPQQQQQPAVDMPGIVKSLFQHLLSGTPSADQPPAPAPAPGGYSNIGWAGPVPVSGSNGSSPIPGVSGIASLLSRITGG